MPSTRRAEPLYSENDFVNREGLGRRKGSPAIEGSDVGADIFRRGLCLPSDNKMLPEDQDRIIEIIKRCFQ